VEHLTRLLHLDLLRRLRLESRLLQGLEVVVVHPRQEGHVLPYLFAQVRRLFRGLERLLLGKGALETILHHADHRGLPFEHQQMRQRIAAKFGLVEGAREPRFRPCRCIPVQRALARHRLAGIGPLMPRYDFRGR
jgi:hypothetical protein